MNNFDHEEMAVYCDTERMREGSDRSEAVVAYGIIGLGIVIICAAAWWLL